MSLKTQLQKIRAKKTPYTIPGTDITLVLQSLTFTEISEVSEFSEKQDTKGALNYILFTALRNALPKEGEDAWNDNEIREFIKDMDGKAAFEIVKEIQRLSGLNVPEDDIKK